MLKIECLVCDKALVLPKFVNINKYDGQIKCKKCKSLLYVKFLKGELQKYKIVEKAKPKPKDIKIIVENERAKYLVEHMGDRLRKPESGDSKSLS